MTLTPKSPRRVPHSLRCCSTGRAAARSNSDWPPQFVQQSSAFHPAVGDQSQFLKRCKLAHDPVRSRCLQSAVCAAALKSP